VERREGHHGDGHGQGEAGRQRQEFTEQRIEKKKKGQKFPSTPTTKCVCVGAGSHLVPSFKVLQLISRMNTMTSGTLQGQQGSGSSWAEYLQGGSQPAP